MRIPFYLWLNAAYPETAVQVDLNAVFTEKTEQTAQIQEDDFVEIYPGVARILRDAGVPIIDPDSDLEDSLLQYAGIPTVASPASFATLRLEFSSPEFVNGVYRIHVSVRRPDGSQQALPALTCGPNCLADNVEAFLREHQDPILALLEMPPDEPAPPATTPCPGASDCIETAPATPPSEPHRSPKLGPLGIAGAAGLGVGVGFLIWGGVSLGLEHRSDWEQEYPQDRRAHYANNGTYAVVGVGGLLVVSGIVMVIVDRVVLPKRRARVHATSFQTPGVSIRF